MKVISIVAQKGGVGKSTLAAHLSVELERSGAKVVAFDLDRQASLSRWSELRGDRTPDVMQVPLAEFDRYVQAAVEDGVDYVVVDTPPHTGAQLHRVITLTDLALVPLRPAFFDLASLAETREFIGSKPHLVILNQMPATGRDEQDVRALLAREFPNAEVAQSSLRLRKAYSAALISGSSVTEIERPSSKAVQEVGKLVQEIKEKLA